jgi:hypothetical protein
MELAFAGLQQLRRTAGGAAATRFGIYEGADWLRGACWQAGGQPAARHRHYTASMSPESLMMVPVAGNDLRSAPVARPS